jgi:hypothetical protein
MESVMAGVDVEQKDKVTKRAASSPLSEDEEKRQCLDVDGSFTTDPDATIITGMSASTKVSIAADLKEALSDSNVLETIACAVAHKVTQGLRQEIASLREQLQEKDRQIESLQDAVDSLEQYSRRNCVRIGPIPESESEDVCAIVEKVASSAGVALPEGAIDRAHRVGKKPTAYQTFSRSIIVKLTSYQHKAALMRGRKNLRTVDGANLFTDVSWPTLSSSNSKPAIHKIFINDDLTKTRSQVAKKARELKKDKRVDDTWVRDGAVHVKRGESKFVFTNMRDLDSFIAGL